MKTCSSCGKKNPDEAKYCQHCGVSLEKENQKSQFDQNVEHFGEEVEKIGRKFEESVERAGRNVETWYEKTFGIFGPLLSALIAFVIFYIIIIAFSFFGDSYLWMGRISDFLQPFLLLLLLLFLLSSYSQYLTKKIKPFRYVSPILGAVIFIVWFWIAIRVLAIIADELNIAVIESLIGLFDLLILPIAILILLLGYVGIITSTKHESKSESYQPDTQSEGNNTSQPQRDEQTGYKRLYRSGKDRILGGVLGGIAEYFHIDPVIVRIVYVLLLVASFGFMVLAYIVGWIIIPRNPYHYWE